MRTVLIKEIMVTPVITVGLEDSFSHVEEKLRTHRIRHLPVVDEENKLVGIITHRDLLRTIAPRKTDDGYYYDQEQLDRFILKYVMTPEPVTLSPEDSIVKAIDLMAQSKYGCIPIVMPDKTLLGIITQIDILKFLARWLKTV